jgi:hypothetical protein
MNKFARVAVVIPFIMALPGVAYGQKTGGVKVEVFGLSIGKPAPKLEGEDSGSFGAFAVQPGTRLTLWLSDPSRQIVDLDEKASKITAFTDDKQTDLLKKETKKGFGGFSFGFGPLSASVSPDKHHCTVEVRADNRPAEGAQAIRLKADLVLKCGAGEKVAETKNASLAKGTKLAGGPLEFKLIEVSNDGFGDSKMTLSLETEGDIAAIKQIAFFDANGKEIKSRRMGWSSSGFGGKMTHQMNYGLEKQADKATSKITYFEKLEALTVPVDLKTGLGF